MCNRQRKSVIVVHQGPDGTYQIEETIQEVDNRVVENSSPLAGLLLIVALYWCWSWLFGFAASVFQVITFPYILIFKISDTLSYSISSLLLQMATFECLKSFILFMGFMTLMEHSLMAALALLS